MLNAMQLSKQSSIHSLPLTSFEFNATQTTTPACYAIAVCFEGILQANSPNANFVHTIYVSARKYQPTRASLLET